MSMRSRGQSTKPNPPGSLGLTAEINFQAKVNGIKPPPTLASNAANPHTDDPASLQQQIQQLREGTLPEFRLAVAELEQAFEERKAGVQRMKEERMRHLEILMEADLKACEDEFVEENRRLRENMLESLISKMRNQPASSGYHRIPALSVNTRKRNQLAAVNSNSFASSRANKKAMVKLSQAEIRSDIEVIRANAEKLGIVLPTTIAQVKTKGGKKQGGGAGGGGGGEEQNLSTNTRSKAKVAQ